MKILYCIAGTYNSGGMERVLSNKANYLAAHGHEVTIVTTDQRGQAPYFELDGRVKCIDLGINYELMPAGNLLSTKWRVTILKSRHKHRLANVLKEIKPDIAISMFCNDAPLLSRMKDDSKKLLEVHFSGNKPSMQGHSWLWRLAFNRIYRRKMKMISCFDRFVVLTHRDLKNWGGEICLIFRSFLMLGHSYATLPLRSIATG